MKEDYNARLHYHYEHYPYATAGSLIPATLRSLQGRKQYYHPLMTRYQDLGLSLTDLEKMDPQTVVQAFYPPDEKRRNDEAEQPFRFSGLRKIG